MVIGFGYFVSDLVLENGFSLVKDLGFFKMGREWGVVWEEGGVLGVREFCFSVFFVLGVYFVGKFWGCSCLVGLV